MCKAGVVYTMSGHIQGELVRHTSNVIGSRDSYRWRRMSSINRCSCGAHAWFPESLAHGSWAPWGSLVPGPCGAVGPFGALLCLVLASARNVVWPLVAPAVVSRMSGKSGPWGSVARAHRSQGRVGPVGPIGPVGLGSSFCAQRCPAIGFVEGRNPAPPVGGPATYEIIGFGPKSPCRCGELALCIPCLDMYMATWSDRPRMF